MREKFILQKVHSELACVDAILRICIYRSIFLCYSSCLNINSCPYRKRPFICAVVCRKVSIRTDGRIVRKFVAENLKFL